jgi:hypothetical protein
LVFELWLACWTQQDISAETGIDQGDLSKLSASFMEIGNLAKNHKAAAVSGHGGPLAKKSEAGTLAHFSRGLPL